MHATNPATRQLTWYLGVMNSDMSGLGGDEIRQHLASSAELSDEELLAGWSGWASRVGRSAISSVERQEEFEAVVLLETAGNRRYRLTMAVEHEAPHRILVLDWQRLYDFDVVVREATEADGPALAEIELQAPIRIGSSSVTFDRSAEYLAAARLMEDAAVVMAEVDGEPAAVEWAAVHRTRIAGRDYRLVNFIHLRVAAEHQRKGLWGSLVRKLNEIYPEGSAVDGDYGCAARDNHSIQTAFASRPRWQVGPTRALITASRRKDASATGRPATPADADRIVELLNDAHGGEEMFLPYTRESLRARLERAPDLYSWDSLRLTDNAVVGVWPAAPKLRVLREANGRVVESRPGLVLDYGYAAGAEQEFRQLVLFWSDWLAAHEHTHLSIFTSEPSTSYPVIASLADQLEPFDLWTTPAFEPDIGVAHGVYADQVYF